MLQSLYQAIKNKSKVNLVYYCHKSNDISAYTVFPILLKEYKNNWYLIIEDKYNEPLEMNLNYINTSCALMSSSDTEWVFTENSSSPGMTTTNEPGNAGLRCVAETMVIEM